MSRSRFALTALALAAIPFTHGRLEAQAGASAALSSSLTCGELPTATPTGSATSQVSSVSGGQYGCSLSASAFSYLGVIGARAQAALNSGEWSSGGISAGASSAWTDGINMTWDDRFRIVGVSTFKLFYNVSATGSVSGSSAADSPAYSGANIGYGFQFAGQRIEGSQSLGQSPVGPWGTISGAVSIGATSVGNGQYTFAPFGFTMTSGANASVAKNYAPGGISSATATAEFGSTLVWQGITGVEAYDASGALIALPNEFRLRLASTGTEGDYWNSSAAVSAPGTTVAPEPATFVLLAVGLLVTGVAARRRRTR